MSADAAIDMGNLPAEPNNFIGRERDLSELARLLTEARIVTLCGPGGIGKTRLALRLALEVVADFPDGIWLVELADATGEVTRRVAAALGVRDETGRQLEETLADALRSRKLLLILDTCEHLADESAWLVQLLLARSPWLRVITTSREPLRARGETVWRVPPLSLPPATGSVAELADHEAVALFCERAAAARSQFALDDSNTETVARLCRTLDGIPLAIELAAAWVRAISLEQIAARLDDRFRLLASGDRTAPARQQTLRATVDWSHERLSEPEQVLLRRLSVFSGWNVEMAEQVCAGPDIRAERVLGLLMSLIDKSLVGLDYEVSGDARYRLLDTIREYAAERLALSGEQTAVRLRHRDCMLQITQTMYSAAFARGEPKWPVRRGWMRRMAAELDNFRSALTQTIERGEAEQGLVMCLVLRTLWAVSGGASEGASWFARLLDIDADVPPQVRGRALAHRADLSFELQDYPAAQECARAGLELSRSCADVLNVPVPLRVLGLLAMRTGDYVEALARIDEAIAAARLAGNDWEEGLALSIRAAITARQGLLGEAQQIFEQALEILRDNNRWGVAHILYGMGGLARARGDFPDATARLEEALAIFREMDARPGITKCLAGLGWVALSQGDFGQAAGRLTESLRMSSAAGQRLGIARSLEAFAVLAVRRGEQEKAARLAGAAFALREAVGHGMPAGAAARLENLVELAGRQLGPVAVGELLEQGRAMTAQEAVSYAIEFGGGLDEVPQPRAAQPARPDGPRASAPSSAADVPSVLTSRELQITSLIARGLSNRAIADELVISPATAARHVANILGKLGFSSRAQVAAWTTRQDPGA